MPSINKILAVIDPNTDDQIALKRAVRMAKIEDASVHAYLGLSSTIDAYDPEALKRVELARFEPWFEDMIAQVRTNDVEITTQLEWTSGWAQAVGFAATKNKSDIIVKSAHPRANEKKRLMISGSERILLDTAPCPVRLVSTEDYDKSHKVLIAFDAKREDENYLALFNEMIGYAHAIKDTYDDGELHAVHVYGSQDDFRHITDISKRLDISTDFVHVVGGKPEEAIVEVAKKIDAQVIVVGLSTKSALMNRLKGYMIDKLLNNIDRDILVVVPKGN